MRSSVLASLLSIEGRLTRLLSRAEAAMSCGRISAHNWTHGVGTDDGTMMYWLEVMLRKLDKTISEDHIYDATHSWILTSMDQVTFSIDAVLIHG